jgi:predicted nucleotide-binding protein (sugar kinase/HSP70/actin superfamily)
LYYQYYPLWKAFLEALGAEVVVSGPTTRRTVAAGSERVVADTCLPVKVYCGHVLSLCNEVDWVLVPAVRSPQLTGTSCAKLAALPDLVRAVIPESPPLLDPEINLDQAALGQADDGSEWSDGLPIRARLALYGAILRVGTWFTLAPKQIRHAAAQGRDAHAAFTALLQQGYTPPQAIARLLGEGALAQCHAGHGGGGAGAEAGTIAVIGHPYNLYDDYVTHRVLDKLRAMGAMVLTPEMLAPTAAAAAGTAPEGDAYWMYEDRVVGAAQQCVEREEVSGLIAVSAFGCAPDSTLLDVVGRTARTAGRAFMSLIVDEHSGEAGLITRLEAFVDMLVRRRRSEGR